MDLSDSQTTWQLGIGQISRQSASDAVTERLTALIHARRSDTDKRLPSETELAKSFGVARSVIRESLGQLKALGLVVTKSGKGTYIASGRISPGVTFGGYTATELLEVRMHLELHTARLAARRSTPDDVKILERLVKDFEDATEPADRHSKDAELHAGIARATGNRLFVRLVGDLRDQIESQANAISSPQRIREAGIEHRNILKAIAENDEEMAAKAMKKHLTAVARALFNSASEADEGGDVAESTTDLGH